VVNLLLLAVIDMVDTQIYKGGNDASGTYSCHSGQWRWWTGFLYICEVVSAVCFILFHPSVQYGPLCRDTLGTVSSNYQGHYC